MQSQPSGNRPKTCVVVSFWNGRPAGPLFRLLSQLRKVDAGSPFDVVVVCNGGDKSPLRLPPVFEDLGWRAFNRENVGFNLAAWDHGWRSAGEYDYYLFIQDDCFVKRKHWLSAFETRFERDPGIGLLGEMVVYDQMSWDYIRAVEYQYFTGDPSGWPEPVHPLDLYKTLFERRGIPWSEISNHLPSIILFTSRRILEEVSGLPYFGPSYREAVAGEFAISRIIESKGYRIAKVTDQPFAVFGHPQWAANGAIQETGARGTLRRIFNDTKRRLRLYLGHKQQVQTAGVVRA